MPEIIQKDIVTPKGLIDFRFEPLEVKGTTIYAVYCNYAGTPHCFHLVQDEHTTEFMIVDKHNCPNDFQDLEQLLSDAIYQFHA